MTARGRWHAKSEPFSMGFIRPGLRKRGEIRCGPCSVSEPGRVGGGADGSCPRGQGGAAEGRRGEGAAAGTTGASGPVARLRPCGASPSPGLCLLLFLACARCLRALPWPAACACFSSRCRLPAGRFPDSAGKRRRLSWHGSGKAAALLALSCAMAVCVRRSWPEDYCPVQLDSGAHSLRSPAPG
jgi:hypothetical protein